MPSEGTTARVPPHNEAAERSVLGSMLLNAQCADTAIAQLSEDDFYHPFHQAIFSAAQRLSVLRQPVDFVTISTQLEKDGRMGPGGEQYLTDLSQDFLVVDNIKQHIKLVKEKATLRKLIDACMTVTADCYAGQKEAKELVDQAADAIYKIADTDKSSEVKHIEPLLRESYQTMSAVAKSKSGRLGIATGFPMMDDLLSGFQKTQLIVIAGRPGMGKTSFALNIVHHAAMAEHTTSLIFSLEMSGEQLATKLLCSEAHVDMQLTRTGRLGEGDFVKLSSAIETLSCAPIYVDDSANITVSEMISKARRIQRNEALGMIVIDYLQLMRASTRVENRTQEVAQMTRALKIMAKELNVPIVLLSQLSRQGEKDGSKYPKLSDLRESGAIEQDADVVIFLQRDDYYVEQQTPENIGKARIIVAKQRNGPTASINVRWDGKLTRYMEEDVVHTEEPEF